jgi:hypothetical protein
MPDEDGEKPESAARGVTETDAPATTSDSPVSNTDEPAASEGAANAVVNAGSAPAAPKKKKKKKKKKKHSAEPVEAEKQAKPAGPVLTAEGWERPAFLADFPSDPELERLVRAFELGDYAFVREHGVKLVEGTTDEGVRRATNELLRRIEPDPLVKILFSMAFALFVFMAFYAYRSHGH